MSKGNPYPATFNSRLVSVRVLKKGDGASLILGRMEGGLDSLLKMPRSAWLVATTRETPQHEMTGFGVKVKLTVKIRVSTARTITASSILSFLSLNTNLLQPPTLRAPK